MRVSLGLLFILSLLVGACSPTVITKLSERLDPLPVEEEVTVYGLQEPFPYEAVKIGTVSIGESGFTINCSLLKVIALAKQEARKVGGNAIKITEHAPPGNSGCHQISATILKLKDLDDPLSAFLMEEENTLKDANYALLHIYRLRSTGALIPFNLYLNESFLVRTENNWKQTIKIDKSGSYVLRANAASEDGTPIEIEMGKEYYIRCGLFSANVVGLLKIELVDRVRGKAEFTSID